MEAVFVDLDDEKFISTVSARWAGLSQKEREEIAGPRAKAMHEDRKTKLTGAHSCEVKAFHDVSTTLCRVESIVSSIYIYPRLETLTGHYCSSATFARARGLRYSCSP